MAGTLSLALLGGSLGVAAGQDDTGAAFRNGTAKATAIVTRVAPGVGALQLALAAGVSVSDYRNDVAQAQAESLDLGLIGGVITAPGCRTGTSAISPDDLPQPTRVDNRKGDAELDEDSLPLGNDLVRSARKRARATTAPLSQAVTEVTDVAVGPVLSIDGGRAESTTQVIDGRIREAKAVVDVGLDLAGVLQLPALRWQAVHRSGAEQVAEATFELGPAKVLGVDLPLEAFGDTQAALNNLLAPSGITIELPRKERITEPADIVRMTPLRITLKDSPAGAAVLGPVLNLSRAQREQLFTELATSICEAAGALLVGDIGVSIASGTGFLTIDVGGVEATTGDLLLEDPFGPGSAPVTTVAGGTGGGSGPLPTLPTIAPRPGGPSGTTGTQPIADVGPLRDRCESLNTLRRTACTEGALLPVGLVGIGATTGVAALDWATQRRRRAAAAAAATDGAGAS